MSTDLMVVPEADDGLMVPPGGVPAPETSLEYAEAKLERALRSADQHHWEAITLIYEIYRTEAWRSARDETGAPYRNFERYISDLRERVPRMSVRWAQQTIAAVLAWAAVGVPITDLYAATPSKVIEATKALDYDKRRGILRGYHVDGGKETALRLLEDAVNPEVRYTDLRKSVRAELKKPETSWQITQVGERLFELAVYHDELPYQARLHLGPRFPPEALDDLRKRLGCPT